MTLSVWVIPLLWVVFFSYWTWLAAQASKAGGTPPSRRAERGTSRTTHLLLMGGAFLLLFCPFLSVGFLAARFVPEGLATSWVGVALAAAGMAFAVAARLRLGRNWSGRIEIKRTHELVRSGPYRVTRHPIYTGILLGLLGSALALGEVRGLVAVALALVAYKRKSATEELWLEQEFGEHYAAYRREVKALIPLVL